MCMFVPVNSSLYIKQYIRVHYTLNNTILRIRVLKMDCNHKYTQKWKKNSFRLLFCTHNFDYSVK